MRSEYIGAIDLYERLVALCHVNGRSRELDLKSIPADRLLVSFAATTIAIIGSIEPGILITKQTGGHPTVLPTD